MNNTERSLRRLIVPARDTTFADNLRALDSCALDCAEDSACTDSCMSNQITAHRGRSVVTRNVSMCFLNSGYAWLAPASHAWPSCLDAYLENALLAADGSVASPWRPGAHIVFAQGCLSAKFICGGVGASVRLNPPPASSQRRRPMLILRAAG